MNAPNGGVRARCAVYPKANKTGFPLWAHGSVVSGDPRRTRTTSAWTKTGKSPRCTAWTCASTPRTQTCSSRGGTRRVRCEAKAVAALRSDERRLDASGRRRGRRAPRITRRRPERIVRVATSGGSKRFKEWAFDEVPIARGPTGVVAGRRGARVRGPRGVPMKTTRGPPRRCSARARRARRRLKNTSRRLSSITGAR